MEIFKKLFFIVSHHLLLEFNICLPESLRILFRQSRSIISAWGYKMINYFHPKPCCLWWL